MNRGEERPVPAHLKGTEDQLRGLVEMLKEGSFENINAGTDALVPVVAIAFRTEPFDDKHFPEVLFCGVATEFNEDEEKHAVMRSLGRTCYKMRRVPLAVAIIAEAWYSQQRIGGPRMRARDDPMRQEIASIMGATNSGISMSTRMPLRRGPGDKIIATEYGELLIDKKNEVTVQNHLLGYFWAGFYEATQAHKSN